MRCLIVLAAVRAFALATFSCKVDIGGFEPEIVCLNPKTKDAVVVIPDKYFGRASIETHNHKLTCYFAGTSAVESYGSYVFTEDDAATNPLKYSKSLMGVINSMVRDDDSKELADLKIDGIDELNKAKRRTARKFCDMIARKHWQALTSLLALVGLDEQEAADTILPNYRLYSRMRLAPVEVTIPSPLEIGKSIASDPFDGKVEIYRVGSLRGVACFQNGEAEPFGAYVVNTDSIREAKVTGTPNDSNMEMFCRMIHYAVVTDWAQNTLPS